MKKLFVDCWIACVIRIAVISVLFLIGRAHADFDMWQTVEDGLLLLDDISVSCTYKKVIDASMRMWGYIQMLHDTQATDDDTCLVCDAIVGRMAQVEKNADALLEECEKGTLLLTDDVVYLVDIFHCIDREYQTIVQRRGKIVEVNMQPLYAAREKFIRLIMI